MLSQARYCYRKSSICLSVCDVVVPWAYNWVCSKVITRIISLGSQDRQSSPRGTPQNSGGIGVGCCFRKPAISLKRSKMGQRLLLMTNRKSHTLSTCAKINDLGWRWSSIIHSVFARDSVCCKRAYAIAIPSVRHTGDSCKNGCS